MADDFPLEQLSPRAFEQLTVALALKVIGPGVEAFGSGPDGGREATYHGNVNWSATTVSPGDSWNGYAVIQAKQRQVNDVNPQSNAIWLRGQIEAELDAWENPESRRGSFPEYILFVTNVRLSSYPGSGGIDVINEFIKKRFEESLKKRGLKGWKVWHRDQLNGLLTSNEGIRNAFPSMLTAGDVLARVSALPGLIAPEKLHPILLSHANGALQTERWVNFSEAGGDSRKSLEQVIIDLPVRRGRGDHKLNRGFILKTLIQQGEYVLRKSVYGAKVPRHVVLTGAPGNGKSTVGKFLIQAYRASFMQDESLSPVVSDVVDGTRAALERTGLKFPQQRRWAVRLDLAEVADELGPYGDKSMFRLLCDRINKRSDVSIEPATLRAWLKVWPWVLVLDGLDEVTAADVRRRILDEIEVFIDEADSLDADLLVILTTRPTGFSERLAPELFHQVDLDYLEPSKAIEYGSLVTGLRLEDDPDRRDTVLARFRDAARQDATGRLLKTPLQVLVLTFILERLGTLPADRYQLFLRYYETIYDREASKTTTLRKLFAEHRSVIGDIHEKVGLVLQVHAEQAGESRASLPLDRLNDIARTRLAELGFEAEREVPRIADQIVQAATQRLVLLVPGEEETVRFEIRSLQELMAARCLSSASDAEVRRRLTLAAPSPHWRNTWVFMAGRLFHEGPDARRDLVSDVVENVDARESWPSWLLPLGPELAADLLEDGLTANRPKWEKRLIDVALRAFRGAFPQDVSALARGLRAVLGPPNRLTYVRNSFKEALAAQPRAVAVACMLYETGGFGSDIPGLPADRQHYRRMWEEVDDLHGASGITSVGALLKGRLEDIEIDGVANGLLHSCLDELDSLVLEKVGSELWPMLPDVRRTWPHTAMALAEPEVNAALELLCGDLPVEQWTAIALLARAVWPEIARRPVGPDLGADLG